MSLFAIIPAAGLSRRMGRPKLTMELAGQPVLTRLLAALQHPDVAATAVVYRRSDAPLRQLLASYDVLSVQPEADPPDMRRSVEYGLAAIEVAFHPRPGDGWLLIPADHPLVEPGLLDELLPVWNESASDILVPVHNGRRGHPSIFRWELASRLSEIPADCGLNWLLTASGISVQQVEVPSDGILLDLDTPADFEKIAARLQSR